MQKSTPPKGQKAELSFPAKSDVIIKVEQVEPGLHIFSGWVKLFHTIGEHLERFDVTVRAALGKISAPLLNFPWSAFVRRVFLDPGQHFAISFAGRELGLQGLGCDSSKAEPMIVARIVVLELSCGAGDLGAALIKDPWKDNVTAQPYARAARRTLREIRRVIQLCSHDRT